MKNKIECCETCKFFGNCQELAKIIATNKKWNVKKNKCEKFVMKTD